MSFGGTIDHVLASREISRLDSAMAICAIVAKFRYRLQWTAMCINLMMHLARSSMSCVSTISETADLTMRLKRAMTTSTPRASVLRRKSTHDLESVFGAFF